MHPRTKNGLIVGGAGLLLNAIVSALFGFCGPVITLLAGGLAGWLAARAEARPIRSDSARNGAVAGAIAGSLMLVGQVIGGVLALTLIQMSGAQPLLGRLPENGAEQAMFWVGGLAVGLCFGVVGVVLGAGAGAGAGYLAWREPAAVPSVPAASAPSTSE